jgi:hypothetical protein
MVSATNLHSVCTSRLDDSSSSTAATTSNSTANSSTASHGQPASSSHLHSNQLSATASSDRLNHSASGTGGLGGSSASVSSLLGVNGSVPVGVRVRLKGEAIDLAVGPYHGAVVTESELVYTWGYNINCSTIGFKGADNLRELSKADPNFDKSGPARARRAVRGDGGPRARAAEQGAAWWRAAACTRRA